MGVAYGASAWPVGDWMREREGGAVRFSVFIHLAGRGIEFNVGKIKGEIERWIYCKSRERALRKMLQRSKEVKGKVLLKVTRFLSARAVGDMIDMGLMNQQRMTVLVVTSL